MKLDVTDLRSKHQALKDERHFYEAHWQSIAERVDPTRARFNEQRANDDSPQSRAQIDTSRIFDGSPALALQRFSAALASLATPKAQMWHDIKAIDEDLADDKQVKEYTEAVRDRLFSARYSANYEVATQECYTDAGVFGNACMYIGEVPGKSLSYKHVPFEQVYWQSNDFGTIDWVDREFPLSAREAYKRFGDELPTEIIYQSDRSPNQRHWFIHMVFPNEDIDSTKKDQRGMLFKSVYISLTGNKIVGTGGFRTMPYSMIRFSGSGNYGVGPCSIILPDIKMLNAMTRDVGQASQLAVIPPMLLANDSFFSSSFNLTPGAMNYGGVDDQGRQRAIPMDFGGSIPIGFELMNQKREIINDALWNTLFQILVDKPQITATEAMIRAQEKGALLAPAAARVESEYLEPTITREIDLLALRGELPDMPEVLAERGGHYQIEYTNPLARYRKTEDGVAIMRAFEQIGVIAQYLPPEEVPQLLSRIDVQEAVKVLLDVNGVPSSIIRSDDEVAEIATQQAENAQAQQQQAELAQLLQAAPLAAGAAKDLSQAQAIAQTAEGQALPDVV